MRASIFTLILLLPAALLRGQEKPHAPAPEPDTLLLNNGEKLIGHLEDSTAAAVTFKSETAGTVSVHWDKIKELKAGGIYAVIPKSLPVKDAKALAAVPEGSLALAGKDLEVTPAAGGKPETVPVADTGFVVTQPDFDKARENHGLLSDWKGGVTGGFALVEATQTSRAYNAALALSRSEPDVGWLGARNRTIVNFQVAYGKVTQPDSADIKTEIFHGDGERDEYFSARGFAFGQLSFDHNFSQGLDLQQLYGGGVGVTVLKRANQQLDLKGSVDYVRQSFTEASNNKNLIGAQFSDTYFYKLPHGILFNQALTVTPSLNITSAWSAIGSAGLVFPAYKRLSVTLAVLDGYLHDPPNGFRKNSFQSTAGIVYTIH